MTRVAVPGTILVATFLGMAVGGGLSIKGLTTLPFGALVAILATLAVTPLLVTRLPLAIGAFLIWLVLEDLVRKLAGNEIRIYFVKDFIFVALLVALILDVRSKGIWKAATGRARILLYVMITWALVMGIPTGLVDWRLPVIGLRLDFMYLPLTAVGFLLAKDAQSLQKWLGKLAILAGVASAVGIAQAIIGPDFLSPARPTPGLHNLVLVRGLAGTGDIYRPTGTFVDPGRFASMALVGLAVGLAALMARRRSFSPGILAATATSAVALWISGGRAPFLIALVMFIVVVAAPRVTERKMRTGPVVIAAVSLVLAMVAITALQPSLISSRGDWYRATLDPGSPLNEWAFRFEGYGQNMVRGIELGGVFGQGTGQESLGRQYIYGGEAVSRVGLYQVEGGYATVAVEWGILGLFLWILWTCAWTWRLWRSVRSGHPSPLATIGVILLTWTIFFLFIGFVGGRQGYQNYIANAYFWLFSGIIFALPHAAKTAPSRPPESQHET